jgi:purine-nucleoside phosphorylase
MILYLRKMMQLIRQTSSFLLSKGIVDPEIGVILGTGLGTLFVEQIQDPIVIHYGEIPNFPVSTVESHHGKLIFGKIKGKRVLAMQGRFHYYEGYSYQQITLPVRVMKMLGARFLLISNAAGNLNLQWKKGEMMLIDDHINLLPDNPLRGENDITLGPRFPDMSAPYSSLLNKKLEAIARHYNFTLRKGIYVGVPGPNLETRAEYRFLRLIGADAVGMSTVPEVIVANHVGLPCCAVSVLTDDCDPDNLKPVNIEEIIAVASRTESKLTDLYVSLISDLE